MHIRSYAVLTAFVVFSLVPSVMKAEKIDPARAAFLHSAQDRKNLADLNQTFDSTKKKYRTSNPLEKQYLLPKFINSASTRKQVIQKLMKTDPQSVISLAPTEQEWNELPDSVKPSVEKRVTLRGTAHQSEFDNFIGKSADTKFELNVGGNNWLNMRFTPGDKPEIASGEPALVVGVQLGNDVAVGDITEEGKQSSFVPSKVFAETFGSMMANLFPSAHAQSTPCCVPKLHSHPGAPASIYLDFDGDFQPTWGSYSNITTPPYDQDGNPGSFSAAELDNINKIWQGVSEDFSPFNIDVTTEQPASFADGVAERAAIGGNGSWTGAVYGGVSYLDSFTSPIPNVNFIFPANINNGDPRLVTESVSHEMGHAFGLLHQSDYDTSGNKIAEYSPGHGDGRAPIMGLSYYATRGLWWNGLSSACVTCVQEDMAIIAKTENFFGYRQDDYGNSISNATPVLMINNQIVGSGVIEDPRDVDVFSFTSGPGDIAFTVFPAPINNDTDLALEIRDANGALLGSNDPADSFGATVRATVAGGSYRLLVKSHGGYGDTGQYTFAGSVTTSTKDVEAPTIPTGLIARVVESQRIGIIWAPSTDNIGVQDYIIMRDGGPGGVSTTPNFVDSSVSPCTTYRYNVSARDAQGNASALSASITIKTSGCTTQEPPPPPPPPPPQGDSTPPLILIRQYPGVNLTTDTEEDWRHGRQMMTIVGVARDVSGIRDISIALDGEVTHTCTNVSVCVYSWYRGPDGGRPTNSVTVRATDNSDAQNSAEKSVDLLKIPTSSDQ